MIRMIATIVLFLAASVATGCSGDTVTTTISLGEAATLKPGQSLSVKGESLDVRFIGITGDSRCPTGATCIWEGEATCDIEVTIDGATNAETLIQSGANESTESIIDRYTFRFTLEPYPKLNHEIDPSEYRLVLTIEKD